MTPTKHLLMTLAEYVIENGVAGRSYYSKLCNAYNDATGEPEQESAKPETNMSAPTIESAADRLKGLSVCISADGVHNYSGTLNKQSRIAVARAVRPAECNTEIEKLKRERDAWIETSRQSNNNEMFYRGIINSVGGMFGVAAKTSDDGSIQQGVLALKVPDLVREALAKRALAGAKEPHDIEAAAKRALKAMGPSNLLWEDSVFKDSWRAVARAVLNESEGG